MKRFLSIGFFLLIAYSATQAQTQLLFESELDATTVINAHANLNFERIIPYAPNPELEQRHRQAGLHLWYLVDAPTEKFKGEPGVKAAKATQYICTADTTINPQESPAFTSNSSDSNRVNDPLYHKQWHYSGSYAGSINLEKAWDIEQGRRNIIVAVADGWIDYTHPDLAPNMWVNEAEMNGLPDVDDDGNGYVDDIHGLNLTESDEFGNHGTHIAGTIAAVNNNGIGVCGVAGGNGIDTGVRVMSIGIQDSRNFVPEYTMARAFVYAADNGAVISSNSWEIFRQTTLLREGIKYFMKYAGQYEGSPMNGGLVVFAAGNDNGNTPNAPLNDPELNKDNLIIVASLAGTGMRSTFSNYGSWIDISAPGGDYDGNGIFSTYPGNRYAFMNGTSMACPHVAGVAALVVSKFGSGTLTPHHVKDIIKTSAAEVDKYQTGYPYIHQMGAGIVDAYAALCSNPQVAPATPTQFSVTRDSEQHVCFTWTVPTDGNGNKVANCVIYAEDEKIPFATLKTSSSDRYCYVVDAQQAEADINSYSIESIDAFGNKSARSESIPVETIHEPIIHNNLNCDSIILYRPNPEFADALPTAEISLYYAKAKILNIEDPNNIVTSNASFSKLVLKFNVTGETPLGTFPLKINYANTDNPDDIRELTLYYSVKGAMVRSFGPTPVDSEKMHLYTSSTQGTFELNLRDYITEPAGLDFYIPDGVYATDEYGEDGWDQARAVIKNEIMEIDYAFAYFEPIMISIKAYNSYMAESSLHFYIHYAPESSITEVDTVGSKPSGTYNLQGIKVSEPLSPGLYIVNGRKTIIR